MKRKLILSIVGDFIAILLVFALAIALLFVTEEEEKRDVYRLSQEQVR